MYLPGSMMPGAVNPPAVLSVTQTDNDLYSSGGTTHTATADFGDVPATGQRRYIVVVACGVDGNAGRQISSFSIGGSAATEGAEAVHESGATAAVAIYYREINTGTSGALSLVYDGALGVTRFITYRVIADQNGLSVRTTGTDTDATVLTTSISSVFYGDVLIGGAQALNGGPYAALSLLTQDVEDETGGGGNNRWAITGSLAARAHLVSTSEAYDLTGDPGTRSAAATVVFKPGT